MKTQLLVHAVSLEIFCTATGRGATHDFSLFKQSRTHIHPETVVKADAGYQGIRKLHSLAQTPKKASKLHPLTPEEKAANRVLARERIPIEHVIRFLKVFHILKDVYRHRRRRFQLRFNLIAALYNHTLGLPK